jgi:hypothetical protein
MCFLGELGPFPEGNWLSFWNKDFKVVLGSTLNLFSLENNHVLWGKGV